MGLLVGKVRFHDGAGGTHQLKRVVSDILIHRCANKFAQGGLGARHAALGNGGEHTVAGSFDPCMAVVAFREEGFDLRVVADGLAIDAEVFDQLQ